MVENIPSWKLPLKSVVVDLLPLKFMDVSESIHQNTWRFPLFRWMLKIPFIPLIAASTVCPYIHGLTSTRTTNVEVLPQGVLKGPPTTVRCTSVKLCSNFQVDFPWKSRKRARKLNHLHGNQFASMEASTKVGWWKQLYLHGKVHGSRW